MFWFQFEIHKYCNGDSSEECDKYFNSNWRIVHISETSESESLDCHAFNGKNETPIALADIYFFTNTCSDDSILHPISQYLCDLQIISAISGGVTDLSFDSRGYAWQIMNCVLTASYSVCFGNIF